MNHLVIRVYAGGDYVYNVVKPEHLNYHVHINKTFRPGCLLYVDGKRVYDGVFKQSHMSKFDDIAADAYNRLINTLDLSVSTCPYS